MMRDRPRAQAQPYTWYCAGLATRECGWSFTTDWLSCCDPAAGDQLLSGRVFRMASHEDTRIGISRAHKNRLFQASQGLRVWAQFVRGRRSGSTPHPKRTSLSTCLLTFCLVQDVTLVPGPPVLEQVHCRNYKALQGFWVAPFPFGLAVSGASSRLCGPGAGELFPRNFICNDPDRGAFKGSHCIHFWGRLGSSRRALEALYLL